MSNLNKQQQAVVDSTSEKILVLAGAGAGKTFTMLARISRLIEAGTLPSSILVLTFTNKAAFDMRDRYRRDHPNKLVPEFRTFHSFCYHLLVIDNGIREALGYDLIPSVPNTETLKRVETEAKMQSGVHLSAAQLSGKDECMSLKDKKELDLYKKTLNRTLKQRNLITFEMLASEVSALFTQDNIIVQSYKKQYKYIFVDEFQDTDPQQVKFISSFPDTHFCVVGDAIQNIYQFRGCTNEIIKMLSKDDSWEHIRLFENYRSTNQICKFANNMSKYADPSYRIEMRGQRDGHKVEIISGSQASWLSPVDADHLNMLLDILQHSPDSKDVAVLCRTNNEVRCVCDKLKEQGILYSSGKRNDDALNILKSVHDNEFMLDWLSSFLTAETYADFIRLSAQQPDPDIFWFAKEYNYVPDIQSRGKVIVDIRKVIRSKKACVSKVADILKLLGIRSGELIDLQEDEDLIPQLIDLIESQGDQDIYVGTIHSSKGLEYDTVYVMGVNDKSFPLGSEDMNNLYYVGLTRAKNHLIVFTA